MVTEALRRVLLAAQGAGRLHGEGVVTVVGEHPICGDVVELDCRFAGEVVAELAWRASGCPATLAVAAVAAEVLPGQKIGDCESRLRQRLSELGGLSSTETHALAMLLRALRQGEAR